MNVQDYVQKEKEFVPYLKRLITNLVIEADADNRKIPTADRNRLRDLLRKLTMAMDFLQTVTNIELKNFSGHSSQELSNLLNRINILKQNLKTIYASKPENITTLLKQGSTIEKLESLIKDIDVEITRLKKS